MAAQGITGCTYQAPKRGLALGKHSSIFSYFSLLSECFPELGSVWLRLGKAAAAVDFLLSSELAKASLCHSSSLCRAGR